jgi:hypothetical protein
MDRVVVTSAVAVVIVAVMRGRLHVLAPVRTRAAPLGRQLGANVCCTVLWASDPYAVVGVREAFKIEPDIVTGPTANTQAGIDLVHKLTGLEALNLLDLDSIPRLLEILKWRLPFA